jgi:hypothetical protein
LNCKAKILLLETVVFAVAAILYGFLFYDTYCEFCVEMLDVAKPLVAAPVKLVAKAEGENTSA